MQLDLDDLILGWPYNPEKGERQVREAKGCDGRRVLQVRVELGVLQLEVAGRPDRKRPNGFATYLDFLRNCVDQVDQVVGRQPLHWAMTSSQCDELDREVLQYYRRRIAWRSLGRHEGVIRDADHTLAILDFVKRHGKDEEYINSREEFRPIVLAHRTEANFSRALESSRPAEAVDALREGIERLNIHQRDWWEDNDPDESPVPKLIEKLGKIEQEIRQKYFVAKTLKERLAEAVAREDYEQAAKLRDEIQVQGRRRS